MNSYRVLYSNAPDVLSANAYYFKSTRYWRERSNKFHEPQSAKKKAC